MNTKILKSLFNQALIFMFILKLYEAEKTMYGYSKLIPFKIP